MADQDNMVVDETAATITDTTTRDRLKREVLPSVDEEDEQPWSGISQESAFEILADYLECVAGGRNAGPLPCENPNTLTARNRRLFVYDHEVVNRTETQRLAQSALQTLLHTTARISTTDLRDLFAAILPTGKKLPYFITQDGQRWSWYVFDDHAKQNQWQSVRVWYTLYNVDRVTNSLLYDTTAHSPSITWLQPLTQTCVESQLTKDMRNVEQLAALLIGMEKDNPQTRLFFRWEPHHLLNTGRKKSMSATQSNEHHRFAGCDCTGAKVELGATHHQKG